jgi:hypothetical protein
VEDWHITTVFALLLLLFLMVVVVIVLSIFIVIASSHPITVSFHEAGLDPVHKTLSLSKKYMELIIIYRASSLYES